MKSLYGQFLDASAPLGALSVALVALGASSAFAMGQAPPSENDFKSYDQSALADFADRFGADPAALVVFQAAAASSVAVHQPTGSAAGCLSALGDTRAERDAFLACLSSAGATSFSPASRGAYLEARLRLRMLTDDAEALHTTQLLRWVEGLASAHQALDDGSGWYVRGKGYLPHSGAMLDFPFEDGDVAIAMSPSPSSGIVASSTAPTSAYAHAIIFHRDEQGVLSSVEAEMEDGVQIHSLAELSTATPGVMTVMRWKDPGARHAIAAKAAAQAIAFGGMDLPYNMAMNMQDDGDFSAGFYCSQLVLTSYSQALGILPQALLSSISTLRSDAVTRFSRRIGIEAERIMTPNDLLSSPYFEVVAEYRSPAQLGPYYAAISLTDLFYEHIERGYNVMPSMEMTLLPPTAWLVDFVPSLINKHATFLPAAISPWAGAVIGTMISNIFNPSQAILLQRTGGEFNPLRMPLWKMRGTLNWSLESLESVHPYFTTASTLGSGQSSHQPHPKNK